MKCRIELLSPLHIGNGNELKLVDFYLDDDKNTIKRIDFEKFIDYCFENGINLMEEMNKRQYMTGRDFSITKFMKINKISPDSFTSYAVAAIIEKRERDSEFAVKEYIKSGGAYIPGSSIKGAIRTALMWYFLNEDNNKDIVFKSLKDWLNKNRINNRDLKKIDDRISNNVFGEDPNNDILRTLKISDTNAVGVEHLEVSEIKIVGNPQDIPVYVENLKTGMKATFDLYLDEDLIKLNFKDHNMSKYLNKKSICDVCNAFSKKIIEEHLRYIWEQYDCGDTVEKFERLRNKVMQCSDSEMLLHIGWGGGWYSTTIGLLVKEYPDFTTRSEVNKKEWQLSEDTLRYKLRLGINPQTRRYASRFPKTRRITIRNEPLGWVKITME